MQRLNIEMLNCYQRYPLTLCDIRLVPEWQKKRIDVKVLQYIMGHAHIDVTMDVYNHVSEMSRIESEITRLESVAIS